MRVIRVAIADEDEGFRSALVDVLAADARFSLAGVVATTEGIVSVVATTRPDLVLLSVREPADDLTAARSVSWFSDHARATGERGTPRIVVMSTRAPPATVERMLRAGASGFLLKGRMGADLADLLVRCVQGEIVLAVPEAAGVRRGPDGKSVTEHRTHRTG